MRAANLIKVIVVMLILGVIVLQRVDRISWHASGKNGALVAGDKEGVEVGLEIFKKGGNAFDVAAATILTLSVTDYHKFFCFGGEVPMIVYDAKRDVVEVLSGQGPAPELATCDYFVGKGNTASCSFPILPPSGRGKIQAY